jgi:hypothetical protein
MERIYRLLCAALIGADLFFIVATQVSFTLARPQAGELVGAMLARLDAATLVVTAVLVVLAGRRPAALLPLAAGLCAAASALYFTPQIHAMRLEGLTSGPRFGMLHGLSTGMLLIEMILLAIAAWIG